MRSLVLAAAAVTCLAFASTAMADHGYYSGYGCYAPVYRAPVHHHHHARHYGHTSYYGRGTNYGHRSHYGHGSYGGYGHNHSSIHYGHGSFGYHGRNLSLHIGH